MGTAALYAIQLGRQFLHRREPADIRCLERHRDTGPCDSHVYNSADYYHMIMQIDSVRQAPAEENAAVFAALGSHTDWVDTDFHDYRHMAPQGARKTGILSHEEPGNTLPDRE